MVSKTSARAWQLWHGPFWYLHLSEDTARGLKGHFRAFWMAPNLSIGTWIKYKKFTTRFFECIQVKSTAFISAFICWSSWGFYLPTCQNLFPSPAICLSPPLSYVLTPFIFNISLLRTLYYKIQLQEWTARLFFIVCTSSTEMKSSPFLNCSTVRTLPQIRFSCKLLHHKLC